MNQTAVTVSVGSATPAPRTFTLVPFTNDEAISIGKAAAIAGKSERTIRNWCIGHGIGRRVAGGTWAVSRVALAMLLDGDHDALASYRDHGVRGKYEPVAGTIGGSASAIFSPGLNSTCRPPVLAFLTVVRHFDTSRSGFGALGYRLVTIRDGEHGLSRHRIIHLCRHLARLPGTRRPVFGCPIDR
jgi:hypothetical protein